MSVADTESMPIVGAQGTAQPSATAGAVKRPRLLDPITISITASAVHSTSAECLLGEPMDADIRPVRQRLEGVKAEQYSPPWAVEPPATRGPTAPATAPVKMARKTPVTTPMSARQTPLTSVRTVSGGSSGSSTPASISSHSPAATKAQQRQQKWASFLLSALMHGRQPFEREHVNEVCVRIAGCIAGDAQEAKDILMMLFTHLNDSKNGELRNRVVEGKLPAEVLVSMGEHELVNPERRKQLDEEFEERAKDTNLEEIQKAQQTTSTLFPCPSCKVRDCTWYQKQTRSADEPMTIFCTCNKCKHTWKRF